MISKRAVRVLIGLWLCLADLVSVLDAYSNSCSYNSLACLKSSRQCTMITQMSSFPLENTLLIEHNNLGIKKAMRWDESSNTFRQQTYESSVKQTPLLNFFKNCFVPSGAISSDYYIYSLWRSAQRFVSATSSVFGTQALLLALGFKSNRIGIAAATTWVLKDALGKVSRIFWASKHGRKFDSDAKKWRFRSSILFATGNGLEIFTYLVPSMFLLTAALANALKQMSMLTSSATRNTIYKSFARSSDNIGDITAKGEAQIAVIDLLGMTTGVLISRAIGASRSKISAIFLGLSIFDLICIFKEIKSVIFTSLNFERANIVLRHLLLEAGDGPFKSLLDRREGDLDELSLDGKNGSDLVEKYSSSNIGNNDSDSNDIHGKTKSITHSDSHSHSSSNMETSEKKDIKTEIAAIFRPVASKKPTSVALTPAEVAVREPILLPTRFGEDTFCSWSGLTARSEVLKGAMDMFAGKNSTPDVVEKKVEEGEAAEKFIVTLSARVPTSWVDAKQTEMGYHRASVLRSVQGVPIILTPQVLLHTNATQFDTFRAMFIVQKILHQFEAQSEKISVTSVGEKLLKISLDSESSSAGKGDVVTNHSRKILPTLNLGPEGLLKMIKDSKIYEKKNMRDTVNLLRIAGWDMGRFTFGTLSRRVEW